MFPHRISMASFSGPSHLLDHLTHIKSELFVEGIWGINPIRFQDISTVDQRSWTFRGLNGLWSQLL